MGGRRSARLRDEAPPPAPPVERPATDAAAAAERRARAAARALEVEDSPRVLRDKCRRLARALRNAKHLVPCGACGILKNTTDSVGPFFKKVPTLSGVTHFDKVYTGAGISTAADIPDYRGPRGVWTRLRRGEAVGRVEVALARPTFTHMALRALWAQGALKFVVSQNCDGLHLRSGLPRRALAELHGDMFAEGCARCRRVYLRAFDTTERTARHRHGTRRLCHACGRELRDSIVHFGERGRAAWPLNWAGALRHAARADVVLCLGSSLKVLRRYPRLWRMHRAPSSRPQLYIVNLQWTPKDAVAALKINARCDAVMRQVARRLRLRVPRYSPRRDPLLAHAEPLAPPEAHTTRRAALRVSPAPASLSPLSSRSPSSPSPSDSDEELPLRRLADRLRGPSHADELHAFRVNLHSGEATILLRTEHAPHPAETSPPRNSTAELRRFRIVRRQGAGAGVPLSNGHCPLNEVPPLPKTEELPSETEQLLPKTELKLIKKEEDGHHRLVNGTKILTEDSKLPKWERSPSPGPLAAAIIARAVLMCRASLYSGLHTIIAPQTAPPPPASPPPEAPAREGATTVATAAGECEWCARRYSSTRCLWYGAPRRTPPESRAWRVVRGRRYLCACCGSDDETRAAEARDEADGGGWYGKGYRKGRRRRR